MLKVSIFLKHIFFSYVLFVQIFNPIQKMFVKKKEEPKICDVYKENLSPMGLHLLVGGSTGPG